MFTQYFQSLTTKSLRLSEQHYAIFFSDVVEAHCKKLLSLSNRCRRRHVKLVIFEVDQLHVFHGILDVLVPQEFLNQQEVFGVMIGHCGTVRHWNSYRQKICEQGRGIRTSKKPCENQAPSRTSNSQARKEPVCDILDRLNKRVLHLYWNFKFLQSIDSKVYGRMGLQTYPLLNAV